MFLGPLSIGSQCPGTAEIEMLGLPQPSHLESFMGSYKGSHTAPSLLWYMHFGMISYNPPLTLTSSSIGKSHNIFPGGIPGKQLKT